MSVKVLWKKDNREYSGFALMLELDVMTNKNSSYTHTHTRLVALFPGLPGWASTRKVKPVWILMKQETVSGSGISWAICKSASRSRQITMPVPTTQKLKLYIVEIYLLFTLSV